MYKKVINMEVDHRPKINLPWKEIQALSLYEFRLDHQATEAANNICRTMGEDMVFIRPAQHLGNRFTNSNLELGNLLPSSRPLELDMDL